MPRKTKRFSRRKKKQLTPSPVASSNRQSKRKQWSDQQMRDAMEAASSGVVSVNGAADMYGVPRSTLKDRLNGRVLHGTKPGPRPYLEESEERELVKHLKDCAEIGLGKTRGEVLRIAECVAESKGVLKGSQITTGWWRRFMERNPGMSLRAGDPTAGVRMDAINEENMKKYFDLLEEVYDEMEFRNHPEIIYNMDETGMPLDPRPPKIVVPKGQKKVRYRCSGQKSQITIIGCGSATGQAIPPFIIFAAKQLNPLWMKDEVPGSRFAVSDNGWIDQDLFHFWLTEHFLTHAVASRPLLLLLDGHSSHFKPDTIRFAKEHGIVVFCLPPHTTHECQSLDCSLFGPLKTKWRSVCHSFHQKHPTAVISKLNFCALFKQAWVNAVTPEVITSGFRKAGVYPLDRARISISKSTNGDDNSVSCRGGEADSNSQCNGDGDHSGQPSNRGDSGDSSSAGGIVSVNGRTSEDPLNNSHRNPENNFSVEKELIYTRRFEEGYDLFDAEYVCWLQERHPEAVPAAYTAGVDGEDPLSTDITHSDDNGDGKENDFSVENELIYARRYEEGYDIFYPEYVRWLQKNHPTAAPGGYTTPKALNPEESSETCTKATPLGDVTNTPSTSRPSSGGQSSCSSGGSTISKFLGPLPERTPSRPSVSKTSGARVLTSAECLALLEEKEERKRREKEEKEQRKLTRELNKKKREEEQKRKAEERVKKAAKKEADKKKKEAEKVAKLAAKVAEKAARQVAHESRQDASTSRKRPIPRDGTRESTRQKAPKLSALDHIDPNTCCACFGLYEDDIGTGCEWLQCSCSRWIHEDCVEDVAHGENGEERICPLCLSI